MTKRIKCPKCKCSFVLKEKKSSLPTSVYHYTSFEVLTKLLKENGKQEDVCHLHFWFSNPLQTNDKKEIHFFNEKLFKTNKGKDLEKQINDIKNRIGNPFTLSLVHQRSNSSNEIPLWKMYGNNFMGVRLKFNFKKLQTFVKSENTYDLIPCEYLNQTQMDSITRNIRNSRYKELEDIYKKAITYKMNEWAYEDEWRIVHWENNNSEIGYRTNDGRLYLPVTIPLDCLDVIEIGPKADYKAIEGSLLLIKEKLSAKGIKVCFNIKKSKLEIGYI